MTTSTTLVDTEALNLPGRFAAANDTHDKEAAIALFTDDAVVTVNGVAPEPVVFHGAAGVRDFVMGLPVGDFRHIFTNVVISAATNDSVTADVDVFLTQRTEAQSPWNIIGVAHHQHVWRRVDDGWRFGAMTITVA